VLVTDASDAEAVDLAEVAVAVPAVVLEEESSSSLAELGLTVPQSFKMLVLHSFCPLALPVLSAIQSEYSSSQMKLGTV
jgi:hypothetical protein